MVELERVGQRLDANTNNYAEHNIKVSPIASYALNLHFIQTKMFAFGNSHRYYLQFEARMGMRIFSDVAIDDFSMSPECFGLNMRAEHLDNYNYYDPRILQDKTPHYDFINHTGIYHFRFTV